MKKETVIRTTLIAMVLVVSCLPGSAQDPVSKATCDAKIDDVAYQFGLIADQIESKNATRTVESLYSKLSRAKTKLSQDKYADSYQKLDDFGQKITDLTTANAKGAVKLDPLAATEVIAKNEDAKCCVAQLHDSSYQCSVP